ncbi:metal-dependent transcriptional regulator [Yeguia hominis]|uniref:Manganese transport regulator n=1 Tax=Yeguia hominis TaxID=2763662 RepID=A0A926D8A0_9FIRM|nr:metal-dependent transcriptional regulator [Yeguia hominis]MBC8532664.1 metal-dependent transcriptional regulator [Yeguia hominis]
MEDYLEMICRLSRETGFVRLNTLADALNVRPSSASKMAAHLKDCGYLSFEKYGEIYPNEKGLAYGAYLLRRHNVLHQFFCLLNQSEEELEQTEQVEHFINPDTLDHLEILLQHWPVL